MFTHNLIFSIYFYDLCYSIFDIKLCSQYYSHYLNIEHCYFIIIKKLIYFNSIYKSRVINHFYYLINKEYY